MDITHRTSAGRGSLAAVLAASALLGVAVPSSRAEEPLTLLLGKAVARADAYHDFISERVYSGSLRLNEWLGGDAAELETQNDTVLRARLALRINQGRLFRVQPSLSGHVALPPLRRKLRLFVDNLSRTVVPGRESDREKDLEEFRTGLRLDLYRRLRSLLQSDVGVKFNPLPVMFTTLSAVYQYQVGNWRLTLDERGFWYSDDGFGELSEMDWDYPISSNLMFRSITAALWSETSKGVEFEQTGRLTWGLTKNRRYLQLEGSVLGHKSSEGMVDDYRVTLTYSTSLYRKWIFFQFAPQADFPREHSFEFTPSLKLSMSAYFGGNYY